MADVTFSPIYTDDEQKNRIQLRIKESVDKIEDTLNSLESSVNNIPKISFGGAFPVDIPSGAIHFFTQNTTGLSNYLDASNEVLNGAIRGDIARFNGTDWVKQ